MTIDHIRRLKPFLIAAALALGIVSLALACGGGGGGAAKTPPPPITYDIAEVEEGTSLRFEPREFTLRPGQQVTFNFSNEGQAIHNMRIAGRDNQYNTDDDAVTQPNVVPSGKAAVLTWTAPEKPGVYNFHCDLHPNSTGTIRVE